LENAHVKYRCGNSAGRKVNDKSQKTPEPGDWPQLSSDLAPLRALSLVRPKRASKQFLGERLKPKRL